MLPMKFEGILIHDRIIEWVMEGMNWEKRGEELISELAE